MYICAIEKRNESIKVVGVNTVAQHGYIYIFNIHEAVTAVTANEKREARKKKNRVQFRIIVLAVRLCNKYLYIISYFKF